MLQKALREVAFRCMREMPILRAHEPNDLVQEGFARVLERLEKFREDASLKTFGTITARNHYTGMARAARIRPKPLGDAPTGGVRKEQDPARAVVLRSSTRDLLGWLRANPEAVQHGWEVLNLLLWTHGNHSYVALAMTLHTSQAWTEERVRCVVRKIQTTQPGRALCAALGLSLKE